MNWKALIIVLAVVLPCCAAADRATYVGGTLQAFKSGASGTVGSGEADALVFQTARAKVRIAYRNIRMIEYGQSVNRRVMLAYAVSPMFLLMKARKHFVTLQFLDDEGQQQALVLRVDKNAIRPLLASLEARTGRNVQYQDDNARRTR